MPVSSATDAPEANSPVTLVIGSRVIQGRVRQIGEDLTLGSPGDDGAASFRQILIDLGAATAPLELWLRVEATASDPER